MQFAPSEMPGNRLAHEKAGEVRAVSAAGLELRHLWLALPVFIVVLAFNFFGDGLRDAADPYSAVART